MDIIKLYEKKKQNRVVKSSINKAYTDLSTERKSKYLALAPFLLMYAFSGFGKKLVKTITKTTTVAVIGAGIVECEVWNKFLIRLYLDYREDNIEQ